jgi:hypothetical protein
MPDTRQRARGTLAKAREGSQIPRDRLRDAGIELLGEPGPTWQHFRGPDGNVYELVAS